MAAGTVRCDVLRACLHQCVLRSEFILMERLSTVSVHGCADACSPYLQVQVSCSAHTVSSLERVFISYARAAGDFMVADAAKRLL